MSDPGVLLHEDDAQRIFRAVRAIEDGLKLPPAPRRRVLATEAEDTGISRWDLRIEATGQQFDDGFFELTITIADGEAEAIAVDWNESAEGLKAKLEALDESLSVTVAGGPLDRRSIVIGPSAITDIQIGENDLLSGRPYLIYTYKAEDLQPDD